MEKTFPGGRHIVEQALIQQGIPSSSLEITISSLSKSSLKSYSAALKKWWSFCDQRSIDLYNLSIKEILWSLTDQYKKGLSYSTINCTRSAISLIARVAHFANDSRVKRFLKGISNLRPSRPKYDQTWDSKIVLDFYEKLIDKDFNLKDLSKS